MYFLFVLVAVITCLVLSTWVVLTVHRLCFVEAVPAYRAIPVRVRQAAEAAGVAVSVGVREIREEQRRVHEEQPYVRYYYTGGDSQGVPAAWLEELWRRRN